MRYLGNVANLSEQNWKTFSPQPNLWARAAFFFFNDKNTRLTDHTHSPDKLAYSTLVLFV